MRVILYGAGGHGKVVADIVRAAGKHALMGFVDDDPNKKGLVFGRTQVLGTIDDVLSTLNPADTGAIVCIGSNDLRVEKAASLQQKGCRLATAVHPDAVLAPDVVVEPGTVVMAGVVINAESRIGPNAIVNTGATIDHDCRLEEGVHVAPGVRMAGGVFVGRLTLVGVGACVIPNIRIGERSVVGAGSVVIRDVPDGVTVAGNPARGI